MVSFSRPLSLTAFATLLSLVTSDSESICYSYGVDFVDEGSYFINSESTEAFTAVSTFKGCNADSSDILLVAPDNIEFLCSRVQTTPDDEPKISTCPIQKNQMSSGHWLLLILGNNGPEGQPFAWQRDLYLTVGPQVTTTYTPTLTFSWTETPSITVTTTSTFTDESTVGPFSTITLPSGTASKIKTVKPKAVTVTSTRTRTKTSTLKTRIEATTTKTVTATCTTPGSPSRPDKPCKYSPTLLHPAALVTPTSMPKLHRFVRKSDRAVDYEWARARVEAAKQKRDSQAGLERRAPDAPTLTVTGTEPVSTTTTIVEPTVTETDTVLETTTVTTTLPASTVFHGILTLTTTLPVSTKTKVTNQRITVTATKTYGATFTKVTTITPTSVITACKKKGGHIW